MNRILHLWRHNRILFITFVFALALVVFFAAKTALFVSYWQDPAHRNQPIMPWMTVGYVAHSWRVPVAELAQALNLTPPPKNAPRPSLERLARDRNQTFDAFKLEIEAAVARLKAGKPDR